CLFLRNRRLNDQVREFCHHLLTSVSPVTWEMELRCDAVEFLSGESLELLFKSGCRQINMGIEKASDHGLVAMNKHLTSRQVVDACRNVRHAAPEMRLAGTFIVGGPNETETDVEKLIEFSLSLDL